MNEDEIYTLIIRAKDEAAAVLEQVRGDVQRMAAQIQQANIIAGASFNELNAQSRMMESGLATTAAAATTHANTIRTGLSTAARDVSTSFRAVESDLSALGGTLFNAAMLTAPLAIAGGEALHLAGDYQAAMHLISAQSGGVWELAEC